MGIDVEEMRQFFRNDRHGRSLFGRFVSHMAEWRFRRRYIRW